MKLAEKVYIYERLAALTCYLGDLANFEARQRGVFRRRKKRN